MNKAREYGESLAEKYCFNEPYPHIVIDDFLPTELAQKIVDNFPVEKSNRIESEYALNYSGIQENKLDAR
jgi:hypothetical protein